MPDRISIDVGIQEKTQNERMHWQRHLWPVGGSPDLGFRNEVHFSTQRIARCHYMLIVAAAAALRWHKTPTESLESFAYGFRVGYSWVNGELLAERFSPGGTSGFDWGCGDEFTQAATLIDANLKGDDTLGSLVGPAKSTFSDLSRAPTWQIVPPGTDCQRRSHLE